MGIKLEEWMKREERKKCKHKLVLHNIRQIPWSEERAMNLLGEKIIAEVLGHASRNILHGKGLRTVVSEVVTSMKTRKWGFFNLWV